MGRVQCEPVAEGRRPHAGGYRSTVPSFEESVANRWIYEDGGWRDDGCTTITRPQGGLEGYGTDRNDPVPSGAVADISGWLMTVSWITPDDEELVLEFGGEPASDGHQLSQQVPSTGST